MRFLSCALVLAAVSTLVQSPAYATQPYDGQWSVEVITEKGTCDRAYRWDLSISDGHVVSTADMPAKATGSVTPKGSIAVKFERGSDTMKATGSASGKWASGEWTAPSLSCSGRWRAERRA